MKISGIKQYNDNNLKKNTNNRQNTRYASNSGSFKGMGTDVAFNVLDKAFSVLDKNAMIQVSVVDTVSTNIPRTLVDLKTGLAAAFETCRREFSGLFVNCLMPGLVVGAIAGLLPKGDLKGSSLVNSWINGDSAEKFKEVYKSAQNSGVNDVTREYVKKSLSSLSGLEGTSWVKYADKASSPEFTEAVDKLTKAVSSKGGERKKLIESARQSLASVTKAENILKFGDKPQANLAETLRDLVDMGGKLNFVKERAVKEAGASADKSIINEAVSNAVDKYSQSLTKFVNKKSLIGMGIVIAIAVSVQTINRAITRKQFNAEGAPIYKDFGKRDTKQKMNEKQKRGFFIRKLTAAAGMYGLAALSMMKKPTLGMFQFSNIFPTMDQCRWIASSTFASRMMGAEDDNELRETTVRDLASFSGLYFLGDYVKKGVASGIEAFSKTEKGGQLLGGEVTLLNRKKIIDKPVIEQGATAVEKALVKGKYRLGQFGNWIKNTELKTALEVSNTKVRNLRNLCRVADIAFSVVMLGILLPKYNRSVTEKKEEAMRQAEMDRIHKNPIKNLSEIQKQKTPEIFKSLV